MANNKILNEINKIANLLQSYETIDVGVKSRKHNHSEDSTKWEGWNIERFEKIEENEYKG